jgi:sulfoxide reductase catalytic subunit YedY
MLIKSKADIVSSEITDQIIFENRRKILKAAGLLTATSLLPTLSQAAAKRYAAVPSGRLSGALRPTNYEDVISYTNYYEFATNKSDAKVLAQALKTDPWSVAVEGEVEKPAVYQLEDILRHNPLEERIYRFRCVEAWSMVVPWIGFPLAQMLQQFKPTSKAKYVEFTTTHQPNVMPGQRTPSLAWPYVEGLRMDEAMHPLAFMATGMYDDSLPKQNGAPLRLVMPWKYGFKSIKAIVKIRFLETMPQTAWNQSAPDEYGFYANVNPNVPHPRWSQSRERVLGGSSLSGGIFDIFAPKRSTEIFNGYGAQVASLYAGMDLSKNF